MTGHPLESLASADMQGLLDGFCRDVAAHAQIAKYRQFCSTLP